MSDYTELKRLALAATAGPWSYDGSYVCPARIEDGTTYVETWRSVADCAQPENTKFIAAANPTAVLALIAETDAMAEFKAHMVSLREASGFDSWSAVLVELDRLKAENERLTKAVGLQVIRRFLGDDDQKNIDELVAAGIQVDKELIAQLKAENVWLKAELDCPFRLARHSKRLVEQLREENAALRQFIQGFAEYDAEMAFAYAAMGKGEQS